MNRSRPLVVVVPNSYAGSLLGHLPGVSLRYFNRLDLSMPGQADFLVPPHRPNPDQLAAISRFDGLQIIQLLSSGYDRLVGRVPPGVTVCNARGVHAPSVAEWVVGSIIALLREFPRYLDDQRHRTWRPAESDTLIGKRVLILGYGSIGAAVEARLLPFGAMIDRVARQERPGVRAVQQLPELLDRAEVLVVTLPLTDQTRCMVDAAALSRLPNSALVVNASRGGVIDQYALIAELRSGRLRAALDVTEPEPLPVDSPFWDMPNVLITPHVAANTRTLTTATWSFVADQIGRHVRGEPMLNVIPSAELERAPSG